MLCLTTSWKQEAPNTSAEKDLFSCFPKEKLTLKGDRGLDLVQGSKLRVPCSLRSTNLARLRPYTGSHTAGLPQIHRIHHFPDPVQTLPASLALEGLLGFHLGSCPSCIKILKQPTIGSADRIRTSGNLSKKRLFSFNSK